MTVQEQRAYVEARWEKIQFTGTGPKPRANWTLRLAHGIYCDGDTQDECYMAAYALTVAREEEIRELGEEVEQMADHAHMALERVRDLIDDGDDGEALVIYVRDVCEYTRTWVRLSAILEELKIGWKI